MIRWSILFFTPVPMQWNIAKRTIWIVIYNCLKISHICFSVVRVRRNVFLTVKESLHNIVKHAEAKKVNIRFIIDKKLSVVIHDNGKGFSGIKNSDGGNGLGNLQKRIESIGGHFSASDGKGVTIEATVPL